MLKKISCLLITAALLFSLFGCKSSGVDLDKLSFYQINAEFNDVNMSVAADMDFEFYNNTVKEISELKFNIFGNAYRENAEIKPVSNTYKEIAYPNGDSYGDMQIKNVSENNSNSDYSIGGIDENILTVKLNESVYPKDKVTINIDFVLTLANIMHRTGYTGKTINLGNWFPILCVNTDEGFYECAYYSSGDPFFSECANYSVNFKVKKSYVVAATGECTGVTDEGEFNNYAMNVRGVRDFALVLSKDFSIISQKVYGTTLNYYYYDDTNAQNSLKAAAESLKYFYEQYGEYPYKTMSVVETGFCYGGMEYPCLTMISDSLTEKQYIETIVHENAHQWWYGLVGNNEIKHSWLDEGLAEYSTVLFFENFEDYGISSKQLVSSAITSYKMYFNISKQILGNVDTSMSRSVNEYLSEYEYVNIAYNKSMLMFDNLRSSIGDKKFFKGLKSYLETYKYQISAPENLIGCFEKIGADTNEYFNSWIDGKVLI